MTKPTAEAIDKIKEAAKQFAAKGKAATTGDKKVAVTQANYLSKHEEAPMKVFVLVTHHTDDGYGNNVYPYVFSTPEKPNAALANYCRRNWTKRWNAWNDDFEGDEDTPEIPPKDDDVIKKYYADWNKDINEGYDIYDCEIDQAYECEIDTVEA